MKLSVKKYRFVGIALFVGSSTVVWQKARDESRSSGQYHKQNQTISRYTKQALLESDTATFEPVSFDRFRPQ